MKIPIFIICFNRLWCLEQVYANLKRCKNLELVFIDNGSTYGETLTWLQERVKEGHCLIVNPPLGSIKDLYRSLATSISSYLKEHSAPYYLVNDSDVIVPCLDDSIIATMVKLLDAHSEIDGLGPMMVFDDVPLTNPDRHTIVKRYTRFCARVNENDTETGLTFIRAPLDTTFGLYRSTHIKQGITEKAFRVMGPPAYRAKHLDWYLDRTKPVPVDHLVYLASKADRVSHWSGSLDSMYVVSLGQRCHTAMWLKRQGLTSQTFPFDHCVSTLDGIRRALTNPLFDLGPVKVQKIPVPSKPTNIKRRVFYTTDFVFPHHSMVANEEQVTWYKRLTRLRTLTALAPSLVFVRSVLHGDEYVKAIELLKETRDEIHLILVIHLSDAPAGLWSTPTNRLWLASCPGLENDGEGTPWRPSLSSFDPLLPYLKTHPSTWKAPPVPCSFDLSTLKSDVYLGSTVDQEVHLI